MALPRFTYNGKTIDLDSDVGGLQPDVIVNALRGAAASGARKVDTVNSEIVMALSVGGFPIDSAALSTAAVEILRRKLENFVSWAQSGRPWTFARNSSKAVNTTLSAVVLAGTKIVTLTSTAGLAAGDTCVIRTKTRAEVVAIDTVDSGVQVTLVEDLDFSYPSTARFRHKEYWPGRLVSSRNAVQNESNTNWRFDMTFVEDVNSLAV